MDSTRPVRGPAEAGTTERGSTLSMMTIWLSQVVPYLAYSLPFTCTLART